MEVAKKSEELAQREALFEEEKKNARQRVDLLEDVNKDKEKIIVDLKDQISQAKEEFNRRYVPTSDHSHVLQEPNLQNEEGEKG